MDSLTQIVLGASVGEIVLGKKVGNKAILWGAIAGTIPDLDVLTKHFVDNIVRANELHRGFSHSIVFCVMMAPLLGWLISKIHKNANANWKDWSWLMFWGLFTHPLLDAHTTWGTQLFWPFDLRIAYKNIFVADPLYTIPFMVFVILAMMRKRSDPLRSKLNKFGLIVSSSYMLLTILFKGYAYCQFEASLERQQIAYLEIETRPTPLNCILWNAHVETQDSFLIGYYSLFDKPGLIRFTGFAKNTYLLGRMANEDLVKRLEKLSENWYTIEQRNDSILCFNDLRFGQAGFASDAKEFVFHYLLSYDSKGKLMVYQEEPRFNDVKSALYQLWTRIKGI